MQDPYRASIQPKSVREKSRVCSYRLLGWLRRCGFQAWRYAGYEATRWLAIALVVTTVPLCGFVIQVVGPRVLVGFIESESDTTKMVIHQITNEAYVHWTMKTGELCPDRLSDLEPYRNSKSTKDAWGNELAMWCGSWFGAEFPVFVVGSAGPDGEWGTNDDLRSDL